MAKTVTQAFNNFLKEEVNIEKEITAAARNSRDWLMEKIKEIPTKDADFPRLYSDINIHIGSFSRKKQIKDLNVIDIMIGLHGEGSTYVEYGDRIEIRVSSEANQLLKFCHDETKLLNSRRVINKFVSALKNIPSYSSSE